ncbi:protein-glutamine gamma-glutamyltransferase [Bacillus sp. DTU_2020_1000418_1_SI_GHA_SEK_038]|uniref:protein-glutamine gamma-glutamyltransferase n=1 Tax=Bacillus sp. DTU_2020_1000418_1_SI_GHA_SEK_038 TaxID=3077585 RepID=UPI0028E78AC7|nr:protein-glutamine gamma-glutamyltransferase [Bacillus sp. DTU_2020_1000418_1_SI_GHA_SEK_038]WNS76924.1 protein-glutamine gamma-glutamyltransferase [Bacillus sp. DTU_2020_1000418_1_SI_GHA_SEK_038]
MIIISNYELKPSQNRFHGTEREIFIALETSPSIHQYNSLHELLFDIRLRKHIILAANNLQKSEVTFAPFSTSKFNPRIWTKIKYGYLLKPSILPSDAIKDVFENGKEYAFECTTAIVIIFYKAVLDLISVSYFNTLFQRLLVWDWNHDQDLSIITKIGSNFIPGDVVYFYNPDYDHPVWTGENAVYLGDGLYFGHGIGIKTEEEMINDLNSLRKKDATKSAYLISQHSRLNTNYLSQFAKRHYY